MWNVDNLKSSLTGRFLFSFLEFVKLIDKIYVPQLHRQVCQLIDCTIQNWEKANEFVFPPVCHDSLLWQKFTTSAIYSNLCNVALASRYWEIQVCTHLWPVSVGAMRRRYCSSPMNRFPLLWIDDKWKKVEEQTSMMGAQRADTLFRNMIGIDEKYN